MIKFNRHIAYLIFGLILSLATSCLSAANITPLTLIKQNKIIGTVLVSPDAKNTVIEVKSVTHTQPIRWEQQLYLVSNQSKKGCFITIPGKQLSQATWSSDSNLIYFIASGSPRNSIMAYTLSNNSLQKVIDTPLNIQNYKLSPDSKLLLINASTPSKDSEVHTQAEASANHLYLYTLDSANVLEQLTPLTISIEGYDWSPDSSHIAISFRELRHGKWNSLQSKIAIVDLKTKKSEIVIDWKGENINPIYSPDNHYLAFLTTKPFNQNGSLIQYAPNYRTCLLALKTNAISCLAKTQDESPAMIGWSSDSKNILLQEYNKTEIKVLSLPINGKQASIYNRDHKTLNFTAALNSTRQYLGFSLETFNQAPEAYISPANQYTPTQITSFQEKNPKSLGKGQIIHWKAADGKEIEGILILPPDYKNGPLPLLVALHGGPASVWSQQYLGSPYLNEYPMIFGLLAQQGVAIFAPNIRGSTGYGSAFRESNYEDIGGKEYTDILSGIHFLIQSKIANPKEVAIWGWSYGGFLSAWALTHDSLFKTGIVGAGISDWISYEGTTDLSGFAESYFGSRFEAQPLLWIDKSPIYHAKQARAAILIQHGAMDQRVPTSQAEELYRALSYYNSKTTLRIYPNQGHAFGDPDVLAWAIEDANTWILGMMAAPMPKQ